MAILEQNVHIQGGHLIANAFFANIFHFLTTSKVTSYNVHTFGIGVGEWVGGSLWVGGGGGGGG